MTGKIRPLAIAVLRNKEDQLLLHKGFDSVKNETFYRPLGGGIEFGEKGQEAVIREFREEIGLRIQAKKLLHVFENIFAYEGKPGHELVLVYEAEIPDFKSVKTSYEIIESGNVVGQAVWRSLTQIREEKAKLYPEGIEAVI